MSEYWMGPRAVETSPMVGGAQVLGWSMLVGEGWLLLGGGKRVEAFVKEVEVFKGNAWLYDILLTLEWYLNDVKSQNVGPFHHQKTSSLWWKGHELLRQLLSQICSMIHDRRPPSPVGSYIRAYFMLNISVYTCVLSLNWLQTQVISELSLCDFAVKSQWAWWLSGRCNVCRAAWGRVC